MAKPRVVSPSVLPPETDNALPMAATALPSGFCVATACLSPASRGASSCRLAPDVENEIPATPLPDRIAVGAELDLELIEGGGKVRAKVVRVAGVAFHLWRGEHIQIVF